MEDIFFQDSLRQNVILFSSRGCRIRVNPLCSHFHAVKVDGAQRYPQNYTSKVTKWSYKTKKAWNFGQGEPCFCEAPDIVRLGSCIQIGSLSDPALALFWVTQSQLVFAGFLVEF